MTVAETAENAADTTVEPLPADQVPHDALYAALSRLLAASRLVIGDVEANSSRLHEHVERLRLAERHATDLLYPPPLPDAPEGVQVLYAHALRKRDLILGANAVAGHRACEVTDVEPGPVPGGVRVTFRCHDGPRLIRADEPFMVQRPKGSES